MTSHAKIRQANKTEKVCDALFVSLFSLLLCCGIIANVTGFTGLALVEKRSLSSAPEWPSSLKEWSEFPAAVERYVNDNFGLRDELIAFNSYFHYRLGISAQPRVLVGTHGWLYYAGDGNWAFYRGRYRFTEGQISDWLDRMEKRQKWLAERGIRFVILPAPVKETIYSDHLPYWLRKEARETVVDQLVTAAKRKPAITIIDVRDRLRRQRSQADMYTPFDTHWTEAGAFVAYEALMEAITPSLPGVNALARSSVHWHPTNPQRIQQDMALMLGIDRFLTISGVDYVPKHISTIRTQYLTDKTGPDNPQLITTGADAKYRIMLVRDSFVWAMLPFLEDTFGAILIRHVQDGPFPEAEIERYHPDVFVLEVQEAGLGAM